MRFELRQATPRDALETAEAYLAARARDLAFLPDVHSDDEVRAWVRDVLLATYDVVVAEADGGVVGFVALDDEFLGHLYVHPEAQGRGIGGALLSRAKEMRPGGFRFWVFQRNTVARAFYERRGCRLVELTDGSANEEREPDALYEWRPRVPG